MGMYAHEFELQSKLQAAFVDEISMVASFITNCSMQVQQNLKDKQTEFLKFIDDRQDFFAVKGINLQPPGATAGQSSSWSGSDQKRTFIYE